MFSTQSELIEPVYSPARHPCFIPFTTHTNRCTSLRDLIKDTPLVRESRKILREDDEIRTHKLQIMKRVLYCCATTAALVGASVIDLVFSH